MLGRDITQAESWAWHYTVLKESPRMLYHSAGRAHPSGWESRRRSLQPTLEELGRQALQPPREQREAIGDEEDAQHDQQRSRDAVYPAEVGSEPLEPAEEAVERQGGADKRDGEPQGVGTEQRRAQPHTPLSGREREDRTQDRPDAGGPCRAEGDADERRAQVAERLARQLEPPLAHEKRWPQDAEQGQPEQDDDDAANPADPLARAQQQHAECRRRGAERDEDEGEAGHEPQRVRQDGATPDLDLLERQPGEETDVARDERQDAGGEEAQQASDERQPDRRAHPQKHTAETTVVQRPSSPHSAVEGTFIVRTISPDSSHCSRRSSHAEPESNGTPSTVASIEAARSSAHSPAVTSFWP